MAGQHGGGQRADLKAHRRQDGDDNGKGYATHTGKVMDGYYFFYFIGIHKVRFIVFTNIRRVFGIFISFVRTKETKQRKNAGLRCEAKI